MQNLTERELAVLTLIAYGCRNLEISKQLNISLHTVKAHIESIYEKLGVTNRVQATIKAIKLDIIKIEALV